LQELPAKGLSTDEIDVVVITHLHPDHVGWNLRQEGGQALLTFPKAKYWITKKDWDHFCQPEVLKRSAHIKSMVLPLETLGALRLVEGEASISSEVTVVPTPGHTPGHMSVAIASQGQRGFITGDMVNYPVQVQETAWECTFDWDHGQARRTREAMLERLEMEGALIGAGHFLPPSFGRLVRTEGRRRWQGL
ncbi:MAG: MBL fold metallo-hydrolase, partial [Chloroflexi bacterium]|nr:MBL fold metallo-hydrolase [Chloroflexota bacterium]